ncbi:acyl-CoA dehydrogenase [Bradyrhizobium sp. INPA01-394B]|jgi:acyl-CoA dehydrogenase|uniref:Acyl-CoA dehydrogenase family protein n=1 Tax=Bradyrhizobium campsiandrae TaxID=1729892 RepID=A0ABR7UKR1_9BRAD|nr:acyl-CoA dehydrogenase family protein [Bradyrhizobium campsiandrae]MBC9881382.1 acyl-CoA dehydrogenase [Bradyrhizobium campsiandrae]MBC9983758.1 acyl-CoA dehydrogenase family protein [Bradyrhizobium campsiandrae]
MATSDVLRAMIDETRRFVRQDLLPAEEWVEEHDDIPAPLVKKMKELGYFGMTIPEQYGGLGLSMFDEVSVVMEIGYASPVFRSYFGTSNGVGTLGMLIDGTEEQRQAYLPRIAKGDLVASFCLTEPGAGSDAAAITTKAVRDGDHYAINGTKRFTTNSPHAGIFTVFARTGPKDAKTAGISAFLVERGTPGITVAPHYKKMGFRGSHTADVIFEDCRVPASALLGGREGIGFKTAMRSLDHARLHMSAVATGLSRRLIDEGVRYASERVQFGKPIAQFQLIQGMLADCEAEALASRSMIENVARMKDEGRDVTKDTACCKYFTTEALGRIADRVLQVHGGYGYIKEYAIERLYRDARLFRIYEGTSQIQQLVVAREMLKQPAA